MRMDMSLVAAIMSMKAGALQQQVATSTLKSNLDTQKSTVLTLLGAGQQALSLANVGDGVGGNLNIAA
jgi:Putative motility protein